VLVPLALTVLISQGRFIASPYWSDDSAAFADAFARASAQDVADARLSPQDDTPTTAAQIPELRVALTFAASAQFDLAAAALDAYATSHPRAAESAWALRTAHRYWHALGRDAEAARTLHRYEADHAAHEPRAAAEFFWSRRDLLTGPQRRDHLRTYLARHAAHGPPDLRIAAEAELAADLWRAACPGPWHGLCVDFTWATRKVTCALARAPLFTVRPRDPAVRREALRHAATAARLSRALDRERVAPWRRPALRAALGQAALVEADDSLETLIALEFPRGMAFFVEDYKNTPEIPKWQREYREQVRRRDDSIRKLHRYWTAYGPRLVSADRRVDALRETGSATAMLLGMTRFALAIGEVMDEQDFIETDSAYAKSAYAPSAYSWCHPSELTRPGRELANQLFFTCAELVRTHGMPDPDLAVCFEGFSRLYGAEEPLPELFSPA